MDPKHYTFLKIYSDCCYSGNWVKQLEDHQEQFEEEFSGIPNYDKIKKDHQPSKLLKSEGKHVRVEIYAACAHDEVATENVFTDLLKGQKPGCTTFKILKNIKYGKGDWKGKEREIGEEQHLAYGIVRIDEL